MSLVYSDSSRWADSLWLSHVRKFASARVVVQEGTKKQPAFPDLTLDVHSLLYLKHSPPLKPDAPSWATDLLTQAKELPEFTQLKQRCLHNGFAAGLAAERVCEALIPLLPDQQDDSPTPDDNQGPQQPQDGTEGQAGTQGGRGPLQPTQDDASAMRRALRQACREASATIDDAEETTNALSDALGRKQGHGPGSGESLAHLDDVRSLYEVLKGNPVLRHIAEMSGRMLRLGQAHKKTLVTPAVGSIKGVTLGGDIERLLPSELGGLRSPSKLLKLQTLDRILSKKALQYLMRGIDSEVRGPLCVLIDESGSMGDSLDSPSVWAKAVNCALLTTATQQKRVWHMIGFTDRIRHEHSKAASETLAPAELMQALSKRSSGGTSFEAPLCRALEVIRQSPAMRKADIVFITDGEASLSQETIAAVQALHTQEGVQTYVILIGEDAQGTALAPIATAMYRVSTHPQTDTGTILPLLAQVG